MDINIARGLLTLILFVLFIVLVVRTYSRARKADYDAMAALPLTEDAGEDGHANHL